MIFTFLHSFNIKQILVSLKHFHIKVTNIDGIYICGFQTIFSNTNDCYLQIFAGYLGKSGIPGNSTIKVWQ